MAHVLGATNRQLAKTRRTAHAWAAQKATTTKQWASNSGFAGFGIAHAVLLGTIFACAVNGSVALAGAVTASVFVSLAMLIGVGAPALDRRNAIRNFVRSTYSTDLKLVVAFLVNRINEANRRVLGDDAPINSVLKRLEAQQAEAGVLERAYAKRVAGAHDEDEGAALACKRNEAAELHCAISKKLNALRAHADDLRTFFAQVRERLDSLCDNQSQAGLDMRLAALKASAAQSAATADSIIADNLTQVRTALDTAQSELQSMVKDSGMAAAAALPSSGNAIADYGRMDAVVSSYLERARALDFIGMLRKQEV